MDFNRDGDFTDPGEQFLTDEAVVAGDNAFNVAVPASAVPGSTFVRFRLNSIGGLSPDGPATDGEVEDYIVEILQQADLEVVKTDGDTQFIQGQAVAYALSVTNNGPSDVTSRHSIMRAPDSRSNHSKKASSTSAAQAVWSSGVRR